VVKIKELIAVVAPQIGKEAGGAAGEEAGKAELTKHDLKKITKEQVAELRLAFSKVGSEAGREAGIKVAKMAHQKV